jgi:uncharacterized membrane protein
MNSSDIRYRARQDLAGKWGVAILAGFLAALLGGLVSSSGGGNIDLDQQEIARLPDVLKTYLLIAASIGAVMGTITLIVGGTVELGYSKFLLKMHDGEDAKVEDLFSQFHRFGDGFCQRLLRALFVALWSLLFVIPGIVASLKYAMTPFILAENPGMTASEAITASKELMDGHKADLFFLQLSFIGWAILNVFTLGIGSLWLVPYINASYAAFYRSICNRRDNVVE